MSFQELGSLGEFIAAVATVTTLVYPVSYTHLTLPTSDLV